MHWNTLCYQKKQRRKENHVRRQYEKPYSTVFAHTALRSNQVALSLYPDRVSTFAGMFPRLRRPCARRINATTSRFLEKN